MNRIIVFLVLITTLAFSQNNIAGYSIFDMHETDGFDIKRAYFQYTDDISDELFFKIRFDVGRDSDGDDETIDDTKLSAYIKNAYVDWSAYNSVLLSLGLISTNTYAVQEKNWGYRFIDKSVFDKYKMTNTADFGIGMAYQTGSLGVSVQLLNGEGYKNIDADGEQSVYFRAMYGEKNLVKNSGYNFGLVGSNSENSDMSGYFAGWSSDKIRIGFESGSYNYIEEVDEGAASKLNQEATGLYANYSICDKCNIFIRHDMNDFDTADNDDPIEQTMVGMVWNPTKGLYMSPNIAISDDVNTYRLTWMFKY